MRLRRLDLLRYGHFTDCSLELPFVDNDLHIFLGSNEAGKSTALAAIEDLLFGVSTRSPYDFLHGYSAMRIGARLENGRELLEIIRRKGAKDTLLGTDGLPFPGGEAALRPFLAGADRSFFGRMFSLDHVRLETGGQEILEAKDEVGQMLFAAGTGITGLRGRLARLTSEADELWASRRAQHRKYYVADDKLKAAEKELRERVLTARKWRELKRAFDHAKQAYAGVEGDFEKLSTESRRLGRIRRVYRHVRRKVELEKKIAALGAVVALPEDAQDVVDAAESKESKASARIDMLAGQRDDKQAELDASTYDERLLAYADDVERLGESRIEVRRMRIDLPKLEAKLEAEQAGLHGLAKELGWRDESTEELVARIPKRAELRRIQSLLNQRGGLDSDVQSNDMSLKKAEVAQGKLQKRFDSMGEIPDIAKLAALVKVVREKGDISGRVHRANQQVKELRQRVDRLFSSLHPGVQTEQAAMELKAPPRRAVEIHRAAVEDLDRRTRDADEQSTTFRRKLRRTRKSIRDLERDERIVSSETLQKARSDRDALWRLVKKKHIERVPVSENQAGRYADALDDLAPALESAMAAADELAELRFDNAEAAARLAVWSQDIRDQQDDLQQLEKQQEALAREAECLDAQWKALWQESGLPPHEPGIMLEWLDVRGGLLDAIEQREGAAAELKLQASEESKAKAALLEQLMSLDANYAEVANDTLAVILERANGVRQLHQKGMDDKAQLGDRLQIAATDIDDRHLELARAKKARDRWGQKWAASLQELGLKSDASPDAVSAQIEIIDQMREVATSMDNLRHQRIDKINGEIVAFETEVATMVGELADDLAHSHPDDAVLQIEGRLTEARSLRDLKARITADIEEIEQRLRKQKSGRKDARESVQRLLDTANVETNGELRNVIKKSNELRTLRGELDTTLRALREEGDGFSATQLEAECSAVDLDWVAAREDSMEADLKTLKDRLADKAGAKLTAEQAMEAIDGDATAARAEAKRQEALAELREVSERYVRVRSSAVLLQWAIDRYRRQKQAPLLTRAGELFAVITGNSFHRLQVDYDSNDKAYLTGLRPNHEVVLVSGMSSGTADQLYLALRIAAIEDYLDRADALPFVADDLFVNFDDQRAAAGFRVLGELARKTQVLFFTHHSHLLDIARETLGGSISIVNMNENRENRSPPQAL